MYPEVRVVLSQRPALNTIDFDSSIFFICCSGDMSGQFPPKKHSAAMLYRLCYLQRKLTGLYL